MSILLILLFATTCFLAYSNGANDNFKGVATLFGSGTTNYKKAITWATITTFLGSIAAIYLAETLVKNFSGKGLVPDDLISMPIFAISIALGAATTVFIATKVGLPISTTHSLVGALFGAGVMAVGKDFNFMKLGNTFLIPLIVSPLMAATASYLAYLFFKYLKKKLRISKKLKSEITNDKVIKMASLQMDTPLTSHSRIRFSYPETTIYTGTFLGIDTQKILDGLHYLSAGIVSFARGLNDTPKIVGLLIILKAIAIEWSMISIAIVIALGGLINAKKVGITMSKKITPMNSGQGLTANLITGLLVTTASIHGMPVSTTHVSVGAIFGIGSATGKSNLKMITKIIGSWALTLPVAAIASAILFKLLQLIFLN